MLSSLVTFMKSLVIVSLVPSLFLLGDCHTRLIHQETLVDSRTVFLATSEPTHDFYTTLFALELLHTASACPNSGTLPLPNIVSRYKHTPHGPLIYVSRRNFLSL